MNKIGVFLSDERTIVDSQRNSRILFWDKNLSDFVSLWRNKQNFIFFSTFKIFKTPTLKLQT